MSVTSYATADCMEPSNFRVMGSISVATLVFSAALLGADGENFRPIDRSFFSLLEMLTSDNLTMVFLITSGEFIVGTVDFSGAAKVGILY